MSILKKILKRVTTPILDQLKQGVTPEKLAQSIAFGFVLGTIPVLGATTSLCLIAAYFFGLNHIAIQTINYVAYPLQIFLIVPFIKIGQWIFREPATPLNISTIINQFKENINIALEKYLFLGLKGVVAWALISPIVFFLIYSLSKILLKSLLKKRSGLEKNQGHE